MPQRTITLLNQLRAHGFSDDDFRVLHHNGPKASIASHLSYCEVIGIFNEGNPTNIQVRDRLELVLASFRSGDYHRPAHPGVFRALATATVAEIPFAAGTRDSA